MIINDLTFTRSTLFNKYKIIYGLKTRIVVPMVSTKEN